ncbi:hypothetical protein HNQ88_003083 [Aureibacter tunicatorum]|uniref:Uncharacterized protein n=1 Tax=Aureibacter tunicatorum TaxID=866807 RepID=A0AAE3XP27_9BACT|nr:hypothetical protein [Aureibacter tunicatorum]BDD04507.1 hypothetical protein AUTU_19900 [Aureibacter tunicatorum]
MVNYLTLMLLCFIPLIREELKYINLNWSVCLALDVSLVFFMYKASETKFFKLYKYRKGLKDQIKNLEAI